MKAGTIIASVLLLAGGGTAAYFAYKKFSGSAQAPAGALTPAGTTPSGVQVYVDQAGKLIDSAGKVVSAATQLIAPKAGSEYENKLIRVDKGKVYLVKDGLVRYVKSMPIFDGRGWESVQEVKSLPSGLQFGSDLAGLSNTPRSLSGLVPYKLM